ncbi:unnamed protein product [Camellia sinensis]
MSITPLPLCQGAVRWGIARLSACSDSSSREIGRSWYCDQVCHLGQWHEGEDICSTHASIPLDSSAYTGGRTKPVHA